MPDLYNIINGGYSNNPKKQQLDGYTRDSELSNSKRQVYTNGKKIIYNVNGTQNLADWGTNAMLGLGKLKQTDRYKEEKSTLEKAKKKHNINDADITGSSLGGAIASHLARENPQTDKAHTFNKASLPFEKTGSNEKHYRTNNDLISIMTGNQKHTKILNNNHDFSLSGMLNAHKSDNLENQGILI